MGIYNRWNEFTKMAEENVGTVSTALPPPAPWRANRSSYFNAAKIFFEVCALILLWVWNFYLWLDVIFISLTCYK